MFVWNKTTDKYYSYGTEITAEEYAEIMSILRNPPEAPDGYFYALNANLEWELCELPSMEEDATETDYQDALREMGVEV